MSFWQSSKPPSMPNKQQLSASEQRAVFGKLKLDTKEVNSIKKALANNKGGNQFLNPNARISLGKMHSIVRQYDQKLANKLEKGFEEYHKEVQSIHEERAQQMQEKSTIKANIARAREFDESDNRKKDIKLELAKAKTRGLDKNAAQEHTDRHGKYHTLNKPTVSARAHDRKNTWQKQQAPTTVVSAYNKRSETKTFEDLKKESKNLPELPI